MTPRYDYSELANCTYVTDAEANDAKAELEARQDAQRGASKVLRKAEGRSLWEINVALGRLKARHRAERAELSARHARELSDANG